MTDLTQSLFRIDPTQGLVEYVTAVKPYHTKILEVLVEYVYTERVDITVGERWNWNMYFTRPDSEIIYACGYGHQWDPYGIAAPEATPTSLIVNATGKLFIDVTTAGGSSTIDIVRNISGHLLSVTDPIVFDFDGEVPTELVPGLTYYITSITPATLEVSPTVGGTPITFTANDTLRVQPIELPYNTFLVQPALNTSTYTALATNTASGQLAFVDGYDIVGVDTVANSWQIAGVITPVPAEDDVIYINGNTSSIANGRYTVDTVVGSTIFVKEDIPPLTNTSGMLYVVDQFDQVPYWTIGAKVKVTSTGTLPTPLSTSATYYFIPSNQVGIFNLATTRYPDKWDDYVDLTSIGSEIQIERVEPFAPGDSVVVSGSYMHHNDGQYVVSTIEPEGAYFRIGVGQSIKFTTLTPAPANDGIMRLNLGTYDMPVNCPVVKSPDLYAGAYIHENLQFTFSITERDFVGMSVVENETRGWGTALFGSSISLYGGMEDFPPYTVMTDGTIEYYDELGNLTSTRSTPTHTILPTGYDTQLFDFGSIDEDLWSMKHLHALPKEYLNGLW